MITITDDILLAALRGQSDCCVDCGCQNLCNLQEHFTDTEQSEMRQALTAVAPLIEREVLERAAAEIEAVEKSGKFYEQLTPELKWAWILGMRTAINVVNCMAGKVQEAAIRSLASEVQG